MAAVLTEEVALYEEFTGDKIPRWEHPRYFAAKLRETFPEVQDWGSMYLSEVLPTLQRCIKNHERGLTHQT